MSPPVATSSRPLVLILCSGNACRSQMAEALLREAAGGRFEVASAGVTPKGRLNARAVAMMAEVGHDLNGWRSKPVDEFLGRAVHTLITVCGKADQACPPFPGAVRRHHWEFRDPAHHVGTEAEIVAEFRAVREEMRRVFAAFAAGWGDALALPVGGR